MTDLVTAILALGSNLGDRERSLRLAVDALTAIPGVRLEAASGIVETPALKPRGVDTQAPAYLNAIVQIGTNLTADDLLDALSEIEIAHGRVRDERWGDRTLDIDIITYGDSEIHTERLTVPHPRAAARAFVLAPWLDVNPDARIPGVGRVDEILLATGETVSSFAADALIASDPLTEADHVVSVQRKSGSRS